MSDNVHQKPAFHGSVVEIDGKGILIRGSSGCGKSSLALTLLDGAQLRGTSAFLIADDRFYVSENAGRLLAQCPPQIMGLMEVRGIGILEMESKSQTYLHLVVDFVEQEKFERYPKDHEHVEVFEHVRLPRIFIVERNPDAAAIVRCFLKYLSSKVDKAQVVT